MTITTKFQLSYSQTQKLEFTHEDVLYALGVVMRASYIDDEKLKYKKITSIKALRMERGYGLLEAKTLIEYAEDLLKKIEGLKLAAALNPID